jgi:hypothetical protein
MQSEYSFDLLMKLNMELDFVVVHFKIRKFVSIKEIHNKKYFLVKIGFLIFKFYLCLMF